MNTIVTKTEVKLDSKPARTRNAKPVYCITDGKVYASGLDAAEAAGVYRTAISAACIGRLKTVKGKKYCFVSDMQVRILDISDAMQEAVKNVSTDKAKEAYEKAKSDLLKKIDARKKLIAKEQEKLAKDEAMYAAMEAEFNI